MALPDPYSQYPLGVDESKLGIGGILFQLEGVPPGTEAGNLSTYRSSERIIMFISFRLSDVETRYPNSEREALAVVRCLTKVRWMVMASKYPVLVYTDHSALRILLTELDNDAHGRIARWQERLGEYHLQLLHRSAKTHFMGIADGLSRLPTRLMGLTMVEDVEGLIPIISSVIAVTGLATDVMINSFVAQVLRNDRSFWGNGGWDKVNKEKVYASGLQHAKVFTLELENVTGEQENGIGGIKGDQRLLKAASVMVRQRWERWLRSDMYGTIVQARLDEWEGVIGSGRMVMGGCERKSLERAIRRYVLVDGVDPKLFY